MRSVSPVADLAGVEEARQFAATVAAIVARHTAPDPWRPGAAASDADPDLQRALSDAGWDELGRDGGLLPLAAPAGAAIGRAFASLAHVDALLGGALTVGGLARYANEGAQLVEPRAGEFVRRRAVRLSRLRTGAIWWELYRDGETANRFVEAYTVPSWDEHLRQHHGRLTGTDAAIERRARGLASSRPHVSHLFPADSSG